MDGDERREEESGAEEEETRGMMDGVEAEGSKEGQAVAWKDEGKQK